MGSGGSGGELKHGKRETERARRGASLGRSLLSTTATGQLSGVSVRDASTPPQATDAPNPSAVQLSPV